jgi:CubicO group peptidase (beta-lactamase class C family)
MNTRRELLGFLACGPLALAETDPQLSVAKPEQVGLSSERLKRLHAFIAGYVDRREIAGAVTVMTRRGKLVEFQAQGYSDVETHRLMRTDDIFRIASMTKPIATVAALMLLEEGRYCWKNPSPSTFPNSGI